MNPKLLEYLNQLGAVGSVPKQSPQQMAELGMPSPDVDSTPSKEQLPHMSVDGFSDTPPSVEQKLRMRKMLEATNSGDAEEVLTLRKQYRDEMDKLNSLVKR